MRRDDVVANSIALNSHVRELGLDSLDILLMRSLGSSTVGSEELAEFFSYGPWLQAHLILQAFYLCRQPDFCHEI